MILRLFSIFDPSSTFEIHIVIRTPNNLHLNWIVLSVPIIISINTYWTIPSRFSIFIINISIKIFLEFKSLSNIYMLPNLLIFVSLIIYYILLNLFRLIPYVFTPSSHVSFNLPISLILWLTFIIYGWTTNTNKILIHLLPINTPSFLIIFIILIETIRILIRPWTLTIRLSANILAGHLLLSLLGSSIEKLPKILIFLLIIQNFLLILEIAVSIIQAYVFSILSLLYFNESN